MKKPILSTLAITTLATSMYGDNWDKGACDIFLKSALRNTEQTIFYVKHREVYWACLTQKEYLSSLSTAKYYCEYPQHKDINELIQAGEVMEKDLCKGF